MYSEFSFSQIFTSEIFFFLHVVLYTYIAKYIILHYYTIIISLPCLPMKVFARHSRRLLVPNIYKVQSCRTLCLMFQGLTRYTHIWGATLHRLPRHYITIYTIKWHFTYVLRFLERTLIINTLLSE